MTVQPAPEAATTRLTRRGALRRAALGAVALAAVAGGLAGAPTASAATGVPIVYSLSATASGTLDGVSFSNALVTMKQVTNTADVVISNGQPSNRVGPVTVTVAGMGQDTLTYGTSFVNQGTPAQGGSAFGFNGGSGFIFSVNNDQFSSYNMDRPFGPVSGPAYRFHRGAITTRGGFYLAGAGTATFTAYPPK